MELKTQNQGKGQNQKESQNYARARAVLLAQADPTNATALPVQVAQPPQPLLAPAPPAQAHPTQAHSTQAHPTASLPPLFDLTALQAIGLPVVMQTPLAALPHDRQKQVYLFSSLMLLSAAMPQVEIEAEKVREANLIGYLIGIAGAGKGIANVAWRLLKPIHRQRLTNYQALTATYQNAQADYRAAPKEERGTPPTPPPYTCLHLPANTTKKGLLLALQANQGRGVLFETETDSLTTANRSEHGQFSDVIRKAAEHETISDLKAGDLKDGMGAIEINHPCLSALLTSTPSQVLALTPDVENGLFSRICWFWLPTPTIDDVYDPAKNTTHTAEQSADAMGTKVLALHTHCLALETPVRVTFSSSQTCALKSQLDSNWLQAHTLLNDNGHALAVRHYNTTARLCLIVQTLLTWEKTGTLPTALPCTAQAFELASLLAATLWSHALHTATHIFRQAQDRRASAGNRKNPDLLEQIESLNTEGLKGAEIARRLNITPMQVSRYINGAPVK